METRENLTLAIHGLPGDVRHWLGVALTSGRHRIGAASYDSHLTVCPIVAAAKEAGVWNGGGVTPGNPNWGTADGPSPEVEEFAAWFDLCSADKGLAATIETVREALDPPLAASVAA